MNKIISCPISDHNCGSKSLLNFNKFPYFTSPLKISDKKYVLNNTQKRNLYFPLKVSNCLNCQHCFLSQIPNQKIINFLYSKYYNYPSPLEGNFKPVRDDIFLNFFKNNLSPMLKRNSAKNVLEVGCYDGYILFNIACKIISLR